MPRARHDEGRTAAEVIDPSMGMVLCDHPDVDDRKACVALGLPSLSS